MGEDGAAAGRDDPGGGDTAEALKAGYRAAAMASAACGCTGCGCCGKAGRWMRWPRPSGGAGGRWTGGWHGIAAADWSGCAAADSGPFDVVNPAPTLTSLSPSSADAGDPDLALTVNRTNFTKTSTVQWNGSPRTMVYVSKAKLTATIPAVDLATAGTATVTVVTSAPGGGTTAGQAFSITTAGGTPDLLITATATPEPVVNSGTVTYTRTKK